MNAVQKDLLPLLKLRLPSMTRVLKTVGRFVQDNPEKIIYQSINEVADASGVSVASVMRLCNELDYSSFASFKLALASELAAGVKYRNAQSGMGAEPDYPAQLSEKLCEVIQTTSRLVHESDIEEVARKIVKARRVLLFGVGASYISASFMSYKLTRLGIANEISTDSHMISMSINLSEHDDLLLLFSGSGSVRDSIELAELAKRKGLPTVAFTNRHKSPLGEVCEQQLVAMGAESPLSSGSLEAKCGQLFIVELVFDAICKLSEVHASRIQGAADAVSDKQY